VGRGVSETEREGWAAIHRELGEDLRQAEKQKKAAISSGKGNIQGTKDHEGMAMLSLLAHEGEKGSQVALIG